MAETPRQTMTAGRPGPLCWALGMTLMLWSAAPALSPAAVTTYTYAPSLGTLLPAQGWTENVDPSATVSLNGGLLSVQSTRAG